ncbi:MAG: haloacid dehalogenase-like hydrolase [Deltaproteobacteria bacterium]|nr:haloacid dehalogenase-like hydrolase [Deltaproteobacteria bacterium]
MTQPLFLQNIIACIWDFDKTLSSGYMQAPIFEHYKVDAKNFWEEVEQLPEIYKKNGLDLISTDTLYLNHILTYARAGVFKGLNNSRLKELGAKIELYKGLPQFFEEIKSFVSKHADWQPHDIQVEHYIVSTGLRQMILGSEIAPYVDGVWGCEFVEDTPPPDYLRKGEKSVSNKARIISQIAYALDNTTKTRAIFEINKGSNKIPEIDVNAMIPAADRRVPFQNMIYVADGPSDIPVFSLINRFGGRTFAVYQPESSREFSQVNRLQKQKRVQSFGEANYTRGSQTAMWIINAISEISARIVESRERALGDKIGKPPRHLE